MMCGGERNQEMVNAQYRLAVSSKRPGNPPKSFKIINATLFPIYV